VEASGGIGIGIGVGFVIGFVVALAFVGTNQGTTILEDIPIIENIPDLVYNEPKLVRMESYYDDDNDRLTITLSLTDKNAEYTTTDGHLELIVKNQHGGIVHSSEYDFTKDDFYSWKNALTGEKITGYRIDINKYLSSGSHDVYVTMETSDGTTWKDLHDSIYSLN